MIVTSVKNIAFIFLLLPDKSTLCFIGFVSICVSVFANKYMRTCTPGDQKKVCSSLEPEVQVAITLT